MKQTEQDGEILKASFNDATRKGGVTMKTTATKFGFLTIAVLAMLCTPLMTVSADAQAYSSYTGAYHAIAYLAEEEVRDNQLKAQTKGNAEITAKADVRDAWNDYEGEGNEPVPAEDSDSLQ